MQSAEYREIKPSLYPLRTSDCVVEKHGDSPSETAFWQPLYCSSLAFICCEKRQSPTETNTEMQCNTGCFSFRQI